MKKSRLEISALIILFISLLQGYVLAAGEAQAWEERFKNEPYIRLLKEVVVRINEDYSFSETTHIIDKVQNEEGKKIGEIRIGYEKGRQDITKITAHTLLPDGSRLPYETEQDLNALGKDGVYSDVRMKVLSMPNVTIGSLVDSQYTVVTSKPVIPGHFYDSFRITCTCPIKEARYKIIAPKGMNLHIKTLNSSLQPKIEISDEEAVYTWESLLIEKDEHEEYMPSFEEIIPIITVSTLGEWKELSAWASSLYRKNGALSPEIKRRVQELVNGMNSDRLKVRAILDYIQKDFRYISMNIQSHSYEPHAATEIFANKFGDCKDQTLLAIAMMSEAGVKAWPVLVSTGSGRGNMDLLPMPVYFDHAIIALELDGVRRYIDVLARGYDIDYIPGYLSGRRSFLIDGQNGSLAELPEADRDEVVIYGNEKVTVKDDGSASVEVEVIFPRALSVSMRERLKNVSSEDREKILQSMEAAFANGGRIIARKWNDLDTPYAKLSLSIQFEDPSIVQKTGNMLIFGRNQARRANDFVSPKRRYPLEFSLPSGIEGTFQYVLPDGYEIMNLPGNMHKDTNFATFTRAYEVQGNLISGKEIFLFKKFRLPAEDYRLVQNFLDDLPKATNEKIMIRRKTAQ